jgi:hypothetical protein
MVLYACCLFQEERIVEFTQLPVFMDVGGLVLVQISELQLVSYCNVLKALVWILVINASWAKNYI